MNPVIQTLKEHISDQKVRFVFPSQVASDLWARKTCTLGIARSVAKNRFLAWDDFKVVLQRKETKREPATSVMRRIFADSLVRKNAERKFLKSVIPPEYAAGGAVFAPFIVRLLPSLSYWEKLMDAFIGKNDNGKNQSRDAEDGDYIIIKKEYAAFLERYDLFEPSWEETKVPGQEFRYVIFFPELIEDFIEYDAQLKAPQFIRLGMETVSAGEVLCLLYQSAREEIRSAVMELQRLHEEQAIPYEDMAVSVPELEEMEPCLVREFSLRQIPFTRRAGKKLGEVGAGRLFSLINECAVSQFSFNSLKALILNDHIPWKERGKNSSLVSFGIRYNCVSSYVQDGKNVDIWEEAFKLAYNDGGRELEPYYRELKRRVLAFAGSKNFSDIRKNYFAFRGDDKGQGLLDMNKISGEDDALLSRCIEELISLVELEEKLNEPSLTPASPLVFFIACLKDTEYVRANQKPGVNIFRWRVAAAAPFSCHFVLNASQGAASVLYQPLKFLRQDKRKALLLDDWDATGAFFNLCNTGEDGSYKCRTRISASTQTFSGWAIAHSFFAMGKTLDLSLGDAAPPSRQDPYLTERLFWREGLPCGASAAPPEIFGIQKRSYELWKSALALKENNFSFLTSPVHADPVRELLLNVILGKDGNLKVTPTRDLNVYYSCSLYWLYARIFRAEEFSLEAILLDDISLGLLYHKILEKLFARIKDEDEVFDSSRLDTYKHWALQITREAIKAEPAFRGPLAIPLVSPQAAGMAKKIAVLLDLEAKNFSGYRVAELELPVTFKSGDLLLKGVIDRISVSPAGEPVIVDYKTSYLPEQTARENLEELPLSEFQMPIYIKLYEEMSAEKNGTKTNVNGAFFYSINRQKIKAVMGGNPGGRTGAPDREEYGQFLSAAEKQIEEFAQKVKALDFVPREINMKACFGCLFKTVCRTSYFLNSNGFLHGAKTVKESRMAGQPDG